MNTFSYSIVILSYNHPHLTEKTLYSVLSLGFPLNKIILVHNGSTSQNVDYLKKIFSQIQHFVMPKNKGFSGGANAGLNLAFQQSENVLFLTNDIEMISLGSEFPASAAIFTPLIYKRQTKHIDSVMGGLNFKTGKLTHFKSTKDFVDLNKNEFLYAPGSAFGITKSCFEILGGFDEAFHTYWEDVDFSYRAQKNSFSIQHSPDFSLLHKIGKTCHKDPFYTLYLFQRNRIIFFKKHHLVSLIFSLHCAITLIKLFVRLSFKPQPKSALKLWWKVLYES